MKQVFSSAVSDRRKGVYRNIRRSISHESSTDGFSYEVATNSEIYGLQQQVISHKEKAIALVDTIKSSVNDPYVCSLISLYNKEMDCVSKLLDNIDIIMYENELKYLLEHEKVLDPSEKSCLVEEFKKMETFVNLGIRSGENVAEVQLNSMVFENLKDHVELDCPILTGILHVLFNHTGKSDKKEKGAVHALALLASLRNKQCRNDVT